LQATLEVTTKPNGVFEEYLGRWVEHNCKGKGDDCGASFAIDGINGMSRGICK
jgi:hypothetical protein